MNKANEYEKMAVVVRLAELKPDMGRTQLMKYAYLLQTVKGVPLGYDFTLFAYGPYDTEVLVTNTYAKHLEAIVEVPEEVGNGMVRKKLQIGPKVDEVMSLGGGFVKTHKDAIHWVVENFGVYNAGEMELIATMVYADQEAKRKGNRLTRDELVSTVLAIKPQFAVGKANMLYERVQQLGVLVAVQE